MILKKYSITKTPSKLLIAKLEAGLRQSNFNGDPNDGQNTKS